MEEKVVLPIKPDEYLFNGPSNCGVYVAKGILSAYELDIYSDPRDYHLNSIARYFGWTLAGSLQLILRIFGLKVERKFAHGSREEKVEFLKSLLRAGNPIILNIGSCYEIQNRWIAKIIPHWVTVWGYDSTDFFLYDSSVPLDKRNLSLLIGNRKVEFQDLIGFWGDAWFFKFKSIFGRRYLYMTVEEGEK